MFHMVVLALIVVLVIEIEVAILAVADVVSGLKVVLEPKMD